MRTLVLIPVAWATAASPEGSLHGCEQSCSKLPDCSSNAHGSYCKDDGFDQPECFGLYFTDASMTSMCYQPNNSACRVCILTSVLIFA